MRAADKITAANGCGQCSFADSDGRCPPPSLTFALGGGMSDRTNNLGDWVCMAVAVILFGLLMGLRTEFKSAWLRDVTAGVAFAVLFTTLTQFRKDKPHSGPQGASPNGGPAKPPASSGVSEGPPSVS